MQQPRCPFGIPAGYNCSRPTVGGDRGLDSDVVDCATGSTAPFVVQPGEALTTIDAGVYRGVRPASVPFAVSHTA